MGKQGEPIGHWLRVRALVTFDGAYSNALLFTRGQFVIN